MKSTLTLLTHLIDYAGLFPPAQLKMPDAVRNFAGYLAGPDEWALGRFIVPVSRLPEFEQAVRGPSEQGLSPGWRLSALVGPDLAQDVQQISKFNRSWSDWRPDGRGPIDTIELRVSAREDIEQAVGLIPDGFQVYGEVLVNTDPASLIEAIGALGCRAKVRTGGVLPEMIPTSADVARFIERCRGSQVSFKATAGLHHPIRGLRPLTYNSHSPSALMHGFLNVFLGATFCCLGMTEDQLLELLDEKDPESIVFDDSGVSWQGARASLDDLATVRRKFAASFGSCSFREPLEGLRSLGIL
jgi:hypothetical protein